MVVLEAVHVVGAISRQFGKQIPCVVAQLGVEILDDGRPLCEFDFAVALSPKTFDLVYRVRALEVFYQAF